MGNRYLSSILGDLRSGTEHCKNLKETLTQFDVDFPFIDEEMPKGIQRLVGISIPSLESAIITTETISNMIEEVLNRG